MALRIQSTRIVETGEGQATVELAIDECSGEHASGGSFVLLRVPVSLLGDSSLPEIQSEAITEAKKVLDEADRTIRTSWSINKV